MKRMMIAVLLGLGGCGSDDQPGEPIDLQQAPELEAELPPGAFGVMHYGGGWITYSIKDLCVLQAPTGDISVYGRLSRGECSIEPI